MSPKAARDEFRFSLFYKSKPVQLWGMAAGRIVGIKKTIPGSWPGCVEQELNLRTPARITIHFIPEIERTNVLKGAF